VRLGRRCIRRGSRTYEEATSSRSQALLSMPSLIFCCVFPILSHSERILLGGEPLLERIVDISADDFGKALPTDWC
jgi:hypothetical protein